MPRPQYPPKTDGYFWISSSTLSSYLACGEAFRRDREDKTRAASHRMIVGSAAAVVADRIHKGELDRGDEKAIDEAAEAACVAELAETEVLMGDPIDALVEACQGASRAFASMVESEPIESETAIVVRVPSKEIEIGMTPDWLEVDSVHDLKVGQSKSWNQGRADKSRQLTTYSLGFLSRFGRLPEYVAIDHLWITKRYGWQYQQFRSTRNQRDISGLLAIIERVRIGLRYGVYHYASESNYMCNPKDCRHFSTCKAARGALPRLEVA